MLNLVRFWILLSSLLVGGGWILSALHQLNRAGYAVVLSLMLPVIFFWWKKDRPWSHDHLRHFRCKFQKRFRHRAPKFFLVIAALSFVSGCLYPALNYDTYAYRLPRVMHWLWAGQWHWIQTSDPRMNIAGCGMEWLSAPLVLFSHNDRLLFLINWVSYLMLPGLIFSVFTRLQVRPRVAWWWAWLLSSGLCFALQASSAANDSFAAIYILAAVDLALRAREQKLVTDLWLSLLAAALATGAKQTNIPLAALWLIAAWPARSLFWKNPVRTAAVAGFGVLVSIVPISVLNYRHCGTWMPLNHTNALTLGQYHLNPFWGIIGNVFCLSAQNLVPPYYELMPPFYSYWADLWNEIMGHFRNTSFGAHFSSFEKFGFLGSSYSHGLAETNAGLGLGICLLIFAACREVRCLKPGVCRVGDTQHTEHSRLLRLAPWGLLLLFMAKVGTYENARHLAPYYVFLFSAWLVKPWQSHVVRQPRWQRLGFFVMAIAAALVVTSAERPLFPARAVWSSLHEIFPNVEIVTDESERYARSHAPFISAWQDFNNRVLSKDETVIGYYTRTFEIDINETCLWLPYGRHRIERVCQDDKSERLRALGLRYVVAAGDAIRDRQGNIQDWLKQYDATCIDSFTFPPELKSAGPPAYYLVRLN